MQIAVTTAAVARTVFEVLIAVRMDAEVDVLAADAVAKTAPAITAGAARAPIATAIAMVKTAVGVERVRTVSTRPDMRSRSISRPRASRCFTASSLIERDSATARTDCPSR